MDPHPPWHSGEADADTENQLLSQLNDLWFAARGAFGPEAQAHAAFTIRSFSLMMRRSYGWGTGLEINAPLHAGEWSTTTDQGSQPGSNFHRGPDSPPNSDGMQVDAAHYSESRTGFAPHSATNSVCASSSAADSSAPPESRKKDATPTTCAPQAQAMSTRSSIPRLITR